MIYDISKGIFMPKWSDTKFIQSNLIEIGIRQLPTEYDYSLVQAGSLFATKEVNVFRLYKVTKTDEVKGLVLKLLKQIPEEDKGKKTHVETAFEYRHTP